jgi:hypothetical protein
MIEIIKAAVASLIGGGIAYGYMRAEINQLKTTMQSYQKHAERLAAIEAKIDILLKKYER